MNFFELDVYRYHMRREEKPEKSLRFSLEGCKSLNYELHRYLQAWPR